MSTGTDTATAEVPALPTVPALPLGAKILRFPTALAEPAVPVSGATGPSAFQRLAAVRRRRGERAVASDRAETATPAAPASSAAKVGTRPSVSQLVTWLLNLRKGGIGYLYWNAAKLPIEVALVRAARLDDGAIVDVVGHRMLVVEPLRSHSTSHLEPTEGVLP